MTVTVMITEQDWIDVRDKLYVCVFKDFATNQFGLNITSSTEVFGSLLEESPLLKHAGAGGCLDKDKVKVLIKFLQDFVEGKI